MRHKVKEKIISKTKYVEHVMRMVNGYDREVIKLPTGGQVMPYFKGAKGLWHIVLVSQYRISLGIRTIEGPGGRIDKGENVKKAMARELYEETGIRVMPQAIAIIFNEHILTSLLDAGIFGGIVKIKADMVKNKENHDSGNGEQTLVEIVNLKDFLKKRREKKIKIDLMTSRLVDEVAKNVGLLVEKY